MADETRRDQPAEAGQEPEGSGVENGGAEEVAEDLDALLADVKRERDEYLALAQRARADFENFRKRAAREAEEAERRGKAAIAKGLLPALDNLERAVRSTGIDPLSGRPAGDPAVPGREAEEAAGIDVDLDAVFDPGAYLEHVPTIFERLESLRDG